MRVSSTDSIVKDREPEKNKLMATNRREGKPVGKVGDDADRRPEHQPPHISPMQPLTREAYGGGMYGKDDDEEPPLKKSNPPASQTQSADGPEETPPPPKLQPPPSTGDRDLDITGQSYIQLVCRL
ncbi:hypothetical protein DM860_009999 [Cuscuta australis]|uniref:Uncharacterized protein n=1 Tax=Cuscuta australis TaxID=267555 RepID=A0A328DBL2_9ASTE|nr:hypothetical protein DM860_009999 [Cuscuta australis]